VVFQREQPFGLPGQQFVGQPLERLAEHDEAAGLRVAGAQVQVGQPAAAPPVSPLDGQHHQVERVPRLDLDPPGTPAARRVRGGERLDHDAFVAVGQRIGEEGHGLLGRGCDQARHEQLGGDGPGQRGVPMLVFGVDQVGALQVEGVEQEHGKRDRRTLALQAGGAGRRVLERQRPAVLAQRDQLAVQHRAGQRQLGQDSHHLGQAGRDVVERPGEQAHVPLGQVRLDPDAVELPFHRAFHRGHAADLGQRFGDRCRAGGEHRPHRAAHLQAERRQRAAAAGQRGGGHRRQRAAQHHGPADLRHRHRSRPRHGLGHDSLQRPLA